MGKVNSWLVERIDFPQPGISLSDFQGPVPEIIPLVIETENQEATAALRIRLGELRGLQGFASITNFIHIVSPTSLIDSISQIDGVKIISYNAPMWIRNTPPSITDAFLGRVELSPITIPNSPAATLFSSLFRLPLTPLIAPLGWLEHRVGVSSFTKQVKANLIPITTGEARKWVGAPEDNKISTKVAVLDTGTTYPHPLLHPTKGLLKLLSTTGEPPFDGLGHGQWCITAAFGDTANTRFGECRGVCDPENHLMSVKCLSNIGFGTSWSVLQAMELAVNEGAKIISMSLGGPLQGGVEEDPQCQFIEQHQDDAIFVVAAGNSGPDPWTIGSPGAAPFAITVGAWSTHYDSVAIFSSRGPQREWYRDHRDIYDTALQTYGADLIKPDIVAPGGGPGSKFIRPAGQFPDIVDQQDGDIPDMIYSGVTGWTDGMQDLTPLDGFDFMRGTCVTQNTWIDTPTGRIRIDQIQPGQRVLSLEGITNVAAVWQLDPQLVYRLVLEGGIYPKTSTRGKSKEQRYLRNTIIGTADHKVFTQRGWVPISELLVGIDSVAILPGRNKAAMVSSRNKALSLLNGQGKPFDLEPGVVGYIAGYLDGEGSIKNTQKKRAKGNDREGDLAVGVTFHNTHRPSLEFMESKLRVGAIQSRVKRPSNINLKSEPKESFMYKISGRVDIIRLLKTLEPYLIIKREKASELLADIDTDLQRLALMNPGKNWPWWSKVESVESQGSEIVYDLTTESHSFIANRLVVHNSMATPISAGIIAYAYDRGLVKTAADVKDRMANTVFPIPTAKFGVQRGIHPIKDVRTGFGLITLNRLQHPLSHGQQLTY